MSLSSSEYRAVKLTFLHATLRNNNSNTSPQSEPIPMSIVNDNKNNNNNINNSFPLWIYQDHAVDIFWLSPTVFVLTHLLVFPLLSIVPPVERLKKSR
jgi:hypothetical protein